MTQFFGTLNVTKFSILRTFRPHIFKHEICQKIHTTGFLGPKFYTVKVHKLQLFLLTKKQRKCNIISNFSSHIMQEFVLFSGKNYTVGTHFTRPSVVMVATNLNSGPLPSE